MKILIFLFLFSSLSSVFADELPHLQIKPQSVTFSGVSSGAYMSVQMHVAHSEIVVGSASVSGGVFWCAKGSFLTAQINCMGLPQTDSAEEPLKKARELETTGLVAPLSNLKSQKAFIFSSSHDNVIKQKNGDRLQNFWESLMPEEHIVHKKHTTAAHGFPTDHYGNTCDDGRSPWILNCQLDLAGEILAQFYGPLQTKTQMRPENLKVFSQSAFDPPKALLYGSGWIYIPTYCQQGGACALHVALHGCQMNPDFIQDQFVQHAGYNEWAESNQIVILYPQTSKNSQNPQACWDWYGLTGPDYVNQKGVQIQALYKMIQAVGGR